MKKITNNSIFNKISLVLNAAILIVFIISMVLLRNFDKVNVEYVQYEKEHDKANEELRTAQQPTRGDSIRLATYQYRLDTLSVKEMPKDKKAADALKETIENATHRVNEQAKVKRTNDSVVAVKFAVYAPIKDKFDNLEQDRSGKKGTFKLVFAVFIILLVIKICVFAFWNYRSALNLRGLADWLKESSSPFWAFVGWLIPAYNFIKPVSFLSEVIDDTECVLEDKKIKERNDKKSSNQEMLRGIWWGMFLIATLLIFTSLNGTFFKTGALFVKLNHLNMAITAVLVWAIYLILDSIVCINFNTLTKQVYDNQSKL
ncbi:MAG: DUF4328 domain-containing protein [Bacteroidales bacterium]|nr:DUF4328 domain-containing protein [Bacteroidales bacterium]